MLISGELLFPKVPEGKHDLATIAICEARMAIAAILHNNEGRNNMITQGIKRWLYRLFAWWPWKQIPETNYTQAVSNSNMGMAQEMMIRTLDGPLPQPGITSVVIEQDREGPTSKTNYPTNEDRTGHPTQPGASLSTEEQTPQTQQPTSPISHEHAITDKVEPTLEQKLTFLKYLIYKGHINEGFEKGQTPEQYRKF